MSDQAIFDTFNHRYFRGRLPRYRIRRVARVPARDLNLDGTCLDARRMILLRRDLAGDDLLRALLHEMCHIGIKGGHGLAFRRRLQRIARSGEPLALDELADLAGWGMPAADMDALVPGASERLLLDEE